MPQTMRSVLQFWRAEPDVLCSVAAADIQKDSGSAGFLSLGGFSGFGSV